MYYDVLRSKYASDICLKFCLKIVAHTVLGKIEEFIKRQMARSNQVSNTQLYSNAFKVNIKRPVRFSVRCHVPMQRRRHLVTLNFNREMERKKLILNYAKRPMFVYNTK